MPGVGGIGGGGGPGQGGFSGPGNQSTNPQMSALTAWHSDLGQLASATQRHLGVNADEYNEIMNDPSLADFSKNPFWTPPVGLEGFKGDGHTVGYMAAVFDARKKNEATTECYRRGIR